jgi:hypothetical protein
MDKHGHSVALTGFMLSLLGLFLDFFIFFLIKFEMRIWKLEHDIQTYRRKEFIFYHLSVCLSASGMGGQRAVSILQIFKMIKIYWLMDGDDDDGASTCI